MMIWLNDCWKRYWLLLVACLLFVLILPVDAREQADFPHAIRVIQPTTLSQPTRGGRAPATLIEMPPAKMSIPTTHFSPANTGRWQFATSRLVHPIALELHNQMAYVIDGGQVLRIDLQEPALPQLLLAPGDKVGHVPVLEPIDLALSDEGFLLVLDRAGDVYRFDLGAEAWTLDRYARSVDDMSGHYFTSVATDGDARFLLDTNYRFTLLYGLERERLWNLPPGRSVDVSVYAGGVFVLSRHYASPQGDLVLYRDTRLVATFAPEVTIRQPRQVVATDTAVYVLDWGGARLLALHPEDGRLQHVYHLPEEVSVFGFDTDKGRLVVAGSNQLFFYGTALRMAVIPERLTLTEIASHHPTRLATLPPLITPIAYTDLPTRDLQLPGAPRHYRLGVHEGLDFYWRSGTAVRAVADGIVIRALVEYDLPPDNHFDNWRSKTQYLGYTSPSALDFYRGMQVWIQHKNGFISRYAHLGSIAPDIEEGAIVQQGQVIGTVGNTGSPASVGSRVADAHLHFELWFDDVHYLGQFLRPIEVRAWLEQIFQ